jgi:hypothetical protein
MIEQTKLCGHTKWVYPDPELCLLCTIELETIEHIFLTCLVHNYAKDKILPNLTLTKVYWSPNCLNLIGNYITLSSTRYPSLPLSSSILSSIVSQTDSIFLFLLVLFCPYIFYIKVSACLSSFILAKSLVNPRFL